MAEFRKFVIEAAAVAIEKRWNAEDAAHLMSFDRHAFFNELAVVALRAAAEAAKAPQVLTAKTVDGNAIKIEAWDKGDILPGFDDKFRRYEAYTTYFRGPGWEEYVQVDKWVAEASGDVDRFREAADLAALAEHGVDVASIEVCAR